MSDDRFADAAAEVDRGEPWRYREEGAPNPLVIEVTGWSNGHTQHGSAEFLLGADRDGRKWSVLVGSTVLRRRLIDGEVSEWNDERGCYVVTNIEGRVQPGEIVALKYKGDRQGTSGAEYADFHVVRKSAVPEAKPAESSAAADDPAAASDDAGGEDGIPF